MAKKWDTFNVVIEPLSKARLHSITDGYPEGRELSIFCNYGWIIRFNFISCKLYQFGCNAIKRKK
jgi:hypothetical protein